MNWFFFLNLSFCTPLKSLYKFSFYFFNPRYFYLISWWQVTLLCISEVIFFILFYCCLLYVFLFISYMIQYVYLCIMALRFHFSCHFRLSTFHYIPSTIVHCFWSALNDQLFCFLVLLFFFKKCFDQFQDFRWTNCA